MEEDAVILELVVQSDVNDLLHVADVRRVWAGVKKVSREGGLCVRTQPKNEQLLHSNVERVWAVGPVRRCA